MPVARPLEYFVDEDRISKPTWPAGSSASAPTWTVLRYRDRIFNDGVQLLNLASVTFVKSDNGAQLTINFGGHAAGALTLHADSTSLRSTLLADFNADAQSEAMSKKNKNNRRIRGPFRFTLRPDIGD